MKNSLFIIIIKVLYYSYFAPIIKLLWKKTVKSNKKMKILLCLLSFQDNKNLAHKIPCKVVEKCGKKWQ